jgi:hypothetical protein
MRTTHAKGADGNECATDDGAERSERIDRHEDHPGAIIRAIVGGERDGKNLAEFRDPKVKASKETIAKSLEGTWLPEQLAIVARQLADWDHVQKQMAACDKDLEALLKEMPAAEVKPVDPVAAEKTAKRQRKKASKNQPGFDIAGEMKRVAGVDLTRIDGIKLTVSN